MRILTSRAMRAVDRAAIDELGVPGIVLMENAAIGVVETVVRAFPDALSAAIFCGPGNNGGDGLAVARHLAVRGWAVEVFLLAGGRELGGDAAIQLQVCRNQRLRVRDLRDEDDLADALELARACDVALDALFGTGLSRPLEGLFAAAVEGIDELPLPMVAVDLPSGLDASRPEPIGPHLHADLTVTFAAPKVAHVFPPAAEAVGEMVVTDLGIPPRLVEEVEEVGGELHLLAASELAELVPEREPGGHKGTFGHAVLVAGSPGKAGAAILAARAAVRIGAGLVTAAVPEPIVQTVDLGSVESMSLGLPAGGSGEIAAGAADAVLELLDGKDALALGPGLGREEPTFETIRRIALAAELPLALDADGVNAFAGRAAELGKRRAETLLTPHPGELARLLGVSTGEVQADRLGFARRAAAETGAVVLLKGSLSLVATPEGAVFVNPTGNPGMASGGTGDVLTGIVAGLLAQGLDVLDAALVGVYVHGLAGDRVAERHGIERLAAGDLIPELPQALARLAGGGGEEAGGNDGEGRGLRLARHPLDHRRRRPGRG